MEKGLPELNEPPNWGKWAKTGPKGGLFEFTGKLF